MYAGVVAAIGKQTIGNLKTSSHSYAADIRIDIRYGGTVVDQDKQASQKGCVWWPKCNSTFAQSELAAVAVSCRLLQTHCNDMIEDNVSSDTIDQVCGSSSGTFPRMRFARFLLQHLFSPCESAVEIPIISRGPIVFLLLPSNNIGFSHKQAEAYFSLGTIGILLLKILQLACSKGVGIVVCADTFFIIQHLPA